MKAVFHLGANGTDLGAMANSLSANQSMLARHGVEFVPHDRCDEIFQRAQLALKGGRATPEMEQMILDAILDLDAPERIVFSHQNLLGLPNRMLSANGLYYAADERISALQNLLPGCEAEFAIALMNPASLVAYARKRQPQISYDQMMHAVDPTALRWPDAIKRILRAAHGKRLIVWCHEDTPLIWTEVMRSMTRIPDEVHFANQLEIAATLLPPDALREARLQIRRTGTGITVAQRRAIVEAALVAHGRADQMQADLDLPGWTQDLVDQITRQYYADVADIAALPGVEFIAA